MSGCFFETHCIIFLTALENIPGVSAELKSTVPATDSNDVADVAILVERTEVVIFSVKAKQRPNHSNYWLQ